MRNYLKAILNKITRKNYYTSVSRFLTGGQAYKPTNKDYLDAYETSFLVYSCVRKIAEKVANTELLLYRIRGNKVNEETDHEILDLIARPNPQMTKFEFLDQISMDLELLGNSYVLNIKGKRTGKPVELHLLRPDWVDITSNSDGSLRFKYSIPGATPIIYDNDEIIHLSQPNPKSEYYGLPTIKPALEIVRNLVYATRWNMNFFYNSARPDFLLLTQANMSKGEKEEFKKMWYNQFGGVNRAHNFGILSGNEAEVKVITPSARDMEFTNMIDMTIQQILAAFGVPKSIVGMTTDVNRATAEAAIYVFLSETIEPKTRRIIDSLNEGLIPNFGEEYYLDFKDPTPENRKAIIEEYDSALKNNWMVINEVRDREGLPPLEGGWDFYLPLSMIPTGELPKGDRNKGLSVIKGLDSEEYYRLKEEKEQEKLKKKVLAGKKMFKIREEAKSRIKKELMEKIGKQMRDEADKKRKKDISKKEAIKRVAELTEEKKRAWWEEHDKAMGSDEKLFMSLIVNLLKSQEKRVIEGIESNFGKDAYDVVDWEEEKMIFASVSVPVYEEIAKNRGPRAARLIGTTFEMTENIREFIDKKAFQFADQVNETTRKKLRKTLKEGVGEGEGIPDLTKRVKDIFKDRETWEAERIARTEVLSSSNGTEFEVYKESGVVEKKEWLATMDDRVRPEHAAMNGEVVGLYESFSNGLAYPAEPNCRCSVLPVIE